MKKNLQLFLLFVAIHSFSQGPNIEWAKCFGGNQNEIGYGIDLTLDGGYILTGSSESADGDITSNNGDLDFWVAKVDASGNLVWQNNFGGSNIDRAYAVKSTSDGGYVVVGHTSSNDIDLTSNKGNSDAWIIKLNNLGVLQWQKNVGGGGADVFNDVILTSDGGFIAVGSTFSNNNDVSGNHGNSDFLVMKFDSSGTIEWQKCFGGSSAESVPKIIQLSDGNFLIGGYAFSTDGDITVNNGMSDYWLVKFNTTGNIIWQKSYGGTNTDSAASVAELADGNILVVGATQSNDGDVTVQNGIGDYWILKLNSSGNFIWDKSVGFAFSDWAQDVIVNSDGSFYVSGTIFAHNNGGYGQSDIGIFAFDSSGNVVWSKLIGGSNYEQGRRLIKNQDGNLVVFGETGSNNGLITDSNGMNDFWLVKFELDILSSNAFTPNDFKVYPNPTKDFINILNPENKLINKVEVIDLNGRVLYFSEEFLDRIDLKTFQNNIYILKLYIDKEVYNCKIIKA